MQAETITLAIDGMRCAACVAHVDKALSNLAGVLEVNVNLATEKATIAFMPGTTDLADFKQAVSEAGYEVRDAVEADADQGR